MSDDPRRDLIAQTLRSVFAFQNTVTAWEHSERAADAVLAVLGERIEREVIQDAVWQFNEAVSMLREADHELPALSGLREEIHDGLPAMQSALKALAHLDAEEKA